MDDGEGEGAAATVVAAAVVAVAAAAAAAAGCPLRYWCGCVGHAWGAGAAADERRRLWRPFHGALFACQTGGVEAAGWVIPLPHPAPYFHMAALPP